MIHAQSNPFAPKIRQGFQYVCDACPCGENSLFALDDVIIADCPHVIIVLDRIGVREIHSIGVRQ